ncbi:MAG: CRISPR-associated protein [Anaerolineae bacterium]|nr:CRISPR-associated protein [Anaerolineae bacterium]
MKGDDIERVTKEYWDRFEPSKIDEAMHWYVCEDREQLDGKSLLEAELGYARQQITAQPCATLVLLVGFSLEPLLQSVCVYKPPKVVLILNGQGYPPEEWHVFAGHITEAIGHLVGKELLPQPPEIPGEDNKAGYPAFDDPSAVFQRLVEVLQDEVDVVIDVTGGKKSMVSGAYLYAAYAGARISYVDFDKYDTEKRRPYGFSCKIGELANPYQTFALRDWERVRALYERYQFREAQEVLTSIQSVMIQVMPDSEQPIKDLVAFLEYYEKWDSGDFRGAQQAASNLPAFEQPSAVKDLGNQWFEISGSDFANKPQHFYGDLSALQVYVCDELARIRRLIDYNEDYRSTFLRAGGVNEIVMLARVVGLLSGPTDRGSLLTPLDERTPDARKVFSVLVDAGKTRIDVRKDIPFKNAPVLSIHRPRPMSSWWRSTNLFNAEDGWDVFLTRRNDLIHKYFSVPKEWAQDALHFAQANFEDFLGHPIADLHLCTTALSWPDLCDLCGLSCFLPPSLRKEA